MRRAIGAVMGITVAAGLGGTVLAGSQAEDPSSPAEAAEALIDGWIEAMGGMESYWQLQSARFTLTTEMWDAESGRLRRTRPRYVTIARTEAGEAARIERWEGDDFIQQGFDGDSHVWAVMNGETLDEGDKDYDEAIYVCRDVFYWVSLPYKLKDPGVFLHYDGVDEDGLHQVRVTFGEGIGEHDDTWFYTFQEGRAVPVRVAYREEGKDNINLTQWEDIQEVDGYFFAGRRVHVDEEGRITKILVTSDFQLNPAVDVAGFSAP